MSGVFPSVNDLGLKILFLLIPGIIAFFIIKSVGPKRPRTDFESGLQIFLYGVVCYAIAGAIEGGYSWASTCPTNTHLWNEVVQGAVGLAALNPETGLGAGQIVFATFIAISLGLLIVILQTHSIPHRILRWLKVTKRTGEVDMWGFTFNSPDLDSWATVRHPNGKVYQGWVRGYSDGDTERELVLVNVKVFAAPTAEPGNLVEVDAIPALYLGLDKTNAVVEFQVTQ